jgi:hypothetical protein
VRKNFSEQQILTKKFFWGIIVPKLQQSSDIVAGISSLETSSTASLDDHVHYMTNPVNKRRMIWKL